MHALGFFFYLVGFCATHVLVQTNHYVPCGVSYLDHKKNCFYLYKASLTWFFYKWLFRSVPLGESVFLCALINHKFELQCWNWLPLDGCFFFSLLFELAMVFVSFLIYFIFWKFFFANQILFYMIQSFLTDWAWWVWRHFHFGWNNGLGWMLILYLWESNSWFWVLSLQGMLNLCPVWLSNWQSSLDLIGKSFRHMTKRGHGFESGTSLLQNAD